MRRAEREATILAAAGRVFAARGYHDASVEDVRREAGIARGTFYLYFESKRAVFERLLDRMLADLERQIVRVDDTQDAAGIAGQMLANVTRVLRLLLGNRDTSRIIMRAAVGLDAGFDRKLEEFYGRVAALVERSLRSGETMGLVRPVDRRVASLAVVGALRQVLDHSLADPASLPDPESLARELLDVVVNGLVAPGAMPVRGG